MKIKKYRKYKIICRYQQFVRRKSPPTRQKNGLRRHARAQ